MRDVIQDGIRGAVAALQADLKQDRRSGAVTSTLSLWTEAVFRYHFCRRVSTIAPDIEQFLECDRIDLVLARSGERAFIEFKFYVRPVRFDPYDGTRRGFKSGPSEQNAREFHSCLEKLSKRNQVLGLSKYIILLYADQKQADPRRRTYGALYDRIQSGAWDVTLQELAPSQSFDAGEETGTVHLFELRSARASS